MATREKRSNGLHVHFLSQVDSSGCIRGHEWNKKLVNCSVAEKLAGKRKRELERNSEEA
jgi:hypothetical protein